MIGMIGMEGWRGSGGLVRVCVSLSVMGFGG